MMTFETEPGFFITADAWGNPAHPPVLLLHGGGQTRHSWGDTGRWLADAGWYALAPDARGHGDSNWSAEGHYGIEFLASDLRAICAHLDQKPALVGASMGGMTALIAEGERVPGAASICSRCGTGRYCPTRRAERYRTHLCFYEPQSGWLCQSGRGRRSRGRLPPPPVR